MTKSGLIQRIAQTQSHLIERDVALAVNMMLGHIRARSLKLTQYQRVTALTIPTKAKSIHVV